MPDKLLENYTIDEKVTKKFTNNKIVAGNIRQLMNHSILVDPHHSLFREFLIQNLNAFFDPRLKDPLWKINLDEQSSEKLIVDFIHQ